MTKTFLLSIIFSMSLVKNNAYCQSAEQTFSVLINLTKGNDFKKIFKSIDSLAKNDLVSNKYFQLYIDREIDLNVVHKRIELSMNSSSFQLDFLMRNDSILLKAVKGGKKSLLSYTYDTSQISIFVEERNKLFGAKKSISDLKRELLISESFAMYCGEVMALTSEGSKILAMVNDEDVDKFRRMTQSFSPEIQAYGIAGLEMLKRNNFEMSDYDNWVIQYIRKRNAEVISCSGCFTIVSKIYSMN